MVQNWLPQAAHAVLASATLRKGTDQGFIEGENLNIANAREMGNQYKPIASLV
jgi:hypothetical protein